MKQAFCSIRARGVKDRWLKKAMGSATVLAMGLLLLGAQKALAMNDLFIRTQEPDYPSYDELKTLSSNPRPSGSLEKKLARFWVTPFIDNTAFYAGVKPIRPHNPLLGSFLRATTWNIEKSVHVPEMIRLMTSKEDFDGMINPDQLNAKSRSAAHLEQQRARLVQSDIFVLQEMEIGIKRSHYLNAAGALAQALQMNYAYAPQYLEVDPVTLGLEAIPLHDGGNDEEAMDYYRVDPKRYKGVFGCAVLSRYPIKYVEIRPLKTQGYDWYSGEKQKIGFMEQSRRFGTKTLFKNEITRELKVGGRGYFRVDLEVPELPEKTLTIINVHLEIKCMPEARERQMKEILATVKNIKNPLILLGDFNAAPTDISSTSAARIVKRTLKNPTTWLSVALNYVSPHGLALNTTRGITNVTKNFNDPFARDVRVIAPNPLYGLFHALQEFRFNDGSRFDFRGDPARSTGAKAGLLANANQRGRKGFRTSFSVKRPIGLVGKYRLDWIFVKQPADPKTAADYFFAPHFGETLEEMNTSLKEPISDHHPSLVDLPLQVPNLSLKKGNG